MEETSEQNKKPEDKPEEVKEEKEIKKETKPVKEKSEESFEEKGGEEKKEEKKQSEEQETKVEDQSEKTKKEEKPAKEAKPDQKKEKPKEEHDKDFKYIVRIANTDINGEKNVIYGLTMIKGIGLHMANLIADKTEIDRYTKIGDLDDKKIEKIKEAIDNINKNAPEWMLNHRKDYETGEDIHLVGSDIDMKLRDEINILKKIRSYRGIRHERGLPVRGQRTRANNRKGLALGVSKKRTP